MNIRISNIKKKYSSCTVVIKDMNLKGRVALIKGNNGSGKSTLLKGISKMITYEGKIINDKSISYMNEHTYYPKGVTVKEIINMFHVKEEFIHFFQLEDKRNTFLTDLSKGMKMKVNLSICLSRDRELYLLDEPFNGLDKTSSNYLLRYINKSDKCFIISSHINEQLKINDCMEYLL